VLNVYAVYSIASTWKLISLYNLWGKNRQASCHYLVSSCW